MAETYKKVDDRLLVISGPKGDRTVDVRLTATRARWLAHRKLKRPMQFSERDDLALAEANVIVKKAKELGLREASDKRGGGRPPKPRKEWGHER